MKLEFTKFDKGGYNYYILAFIPLATVHCCIIISSSEFQALRKVHTVSMTIAPYPASRASSPWGGRVGGEGEFLLYICPVC